MKIDPGLEFQRKEKGNKYTKIHLAELNMNGLLNAMKSLRFVRYESLRPIQYWNENISLLGYLKPIMLFLGVLPYKLANINKQLYRVYQYVVQITFFLFLIPFYVKAPYLEGPIVLLFRNVSILSTYSIMYIKGLVCLTNIMKDLILDMVFKESKIRSTSDEEIVEIYMTVVYKSRAVQIFYIILTYSTGILFVGPSVWHAIFWNKTNFTSSTQAGEFLPYAMRMPFDEYEHHYLALGLQIFCAFLAINYYCFIQCILVILPLNIIFRLKVLGHNLKNMNSLIKSLNTSGTLNMDIIKREIVVCIKEHTDIIRYCDTLNKAIKNLMLLEFLLSSAQISLALIQLTSTKEADVILFSLIYFFQLLIQLLILYWYADEIREQSIAITDVLYEIHWYQYNKSINVTIQIMMIRCQKPLSLTVGSFGEMSLGMAVKIIKAAYTYVTFMQQTYGGK